MMFEKLLGKDVQEFILMNKSVDIKKLSLQKLPFDQELRPHILQQIKARQKAEHKLRDYATREGIIFPNADLVEQASSDDTARYKADICPQGHLFVDLTAGLGRDALAVSEKFTTGYCIDADPAHAQTLAHNFKILSDKNILVSNDYAEKFIQNIKSADCILIDPQRRTDTGKRGIYDLSQTRPNLLELLPLLREKSPFILIKTSPFLDIAEGLKQLGRVQEVHILESEGDCKEVLYVIDKAKEHEELRIYSSICTPRKVFQMSYDALQAATCPLHDPLLYLYEPCPALMKSGAHVAYASEKELFKLAPMTHLYTSQTPLADFMGRRFIIDAVLPVKKQEVHAALEKDRVNITPRNFPLSVEALRKKLQVKDGGDQTLFACTLQDGSLRLILCRKVYS
ncbi:MAG: hypothetical protein H6854_04915 [Rhodospirillales bacterium]|nr:hypothetical protein [Rhodospirillales bacterium]